MSFASPQRDDVPLPGIVLPARRQPVKPTDIYALALNRYNKLILSSSGALLDELAAELGRRSDALIADGSSAIASAVLSGEHAVAWLSSVTFSPIHELAESEYSRVQVGLSGVVVHRYDQKYLIHVPDTLVEYFCNLFRTTTSVERA
ncbi:hypothetical protein [Burkholderia pyrrocinia]|uniref:hypothetical protein n=1 Tax=Burkholderia pyrrocinia TaxID=60550 RepID=UPI002AB10C40|nr:hypothetical protein [Burkholderia pyrrocinia]